MMWSICEHPDPRPAIRDKMKGLRFHGRFCGYLMETRDGALVANLIVYMGDDTRLDLANWLAAELGKPVARVTAAPKPPTKKVAIEDDRQGDASGTKQGFFRKWFY